MSHGKPVTTAEPATPDIPAGDGPDGDGRDGDEIVSRRGISPLLWPLVALRLAGLGLALVAGLLCYALSAPFTHANPAPRLFLCAVAVLSGVRLRRVGRPAGRPAMLLANHVSWLDVPALAGACGTAFVAHDGLAGFGPLRWLCELNDTVFVARHDRRSVAAQVEQVRRAIDELGSLTIFPEGTTSDGSLLLPFKSSLLSATETDSEGLAIQPVWLDYGPDAGEIAWVGEESGLDNALRLLARLRPITLTLHFLPPLEGPDRANRKRIAACAHAAISAAMSATGKGKGKGKGKG